MQIDGNTRYRTMNAQIRPPCLHDDLRGETKSKRGELVWLECVNERRSSTGIRIKRFQFVSIHFTSDVPQPKVGYLIARLHLLQQTRYSQCSDTNPGVTLGNRGVSSSGARWTLKLPVLVTTIKIQERPISGMEPRRCREAFHVCTRRHISISMEGRLYKSPAHQLAHPLDRFIRLETDITLNEIVSFSSQKEPLSDKKSDRTSGCAERSSAHVPYDPTVVMCFGLNGDRVQSPSVLHVCADVFGVAWLLPVTETTMTEIAPL